MGVKDRYSYRATTDIRSRLARRFKEMAVGFRIGRGRAHYD